MSPSLTRRDMLRNAAAAAAAIILPGVLTARANEGPTASWVDPDRDRLLAWTAALRNGGRPVPSRPGSRVTSCFL